MIPVVRVNKPRRVSEAQSTSPDAEGEPRSRSSHYPTVPISDVAELMTKARPEQIQRPIPDAGVRSL